MAWHAETPWAERKRRKAREAAVAESRMQRLVHVVDLWKCGDIEHERALAEAKAVIDGEADRVIRVE